MKKSHTDKVQVWYTLDKPPQGKAAFLHPSGSSSYCHLQKDLNKEITSDEILRFQESRLKTTHRIPQKLKHGDNTFVIGSH